ncbi:toll-like receptor 4 [Physella acuta]|uniref:toll-like receptor 4 n=1 Tax=Physella acuta TaxID=109671 RepID=UPI0027DE7823|nr:toll-like receptor 4 [Physella acuta]
MNNLHYTLKITIVLLICTCHKIVIADYNLQKLQSSPCSITTSSIDVTVDCTNRGIKQINPTWFPKNATKIFLDNNRIRTVENFTFQHVAHLLVLSLTYNNIDTIHVNAFLGIETLQVLNLEFNKIDITSNRSFPKLVLHPLKNLKVLKLRQGLKIKTGDYPVKYFTCQSSLTNLSIDTVSDLLYFGPEFLNFTRLTRLELGGSANNITSKTFENVKRIRELYVTGLDKIVWISRNAFSALHELDVLHLENVYCGVRKALSLLWSFSGRNMSSIVLSQIYHNYYTSDQGLLKNDSFIYPSMTKYLTSICLKSFSFTNNKVFVIVGEAFYSSVWSSCLREIDLSENPLRGTNWALIKLSTLRNLEFVVIENLLRVRYLKKFNWEKYFSLTEKSSVDKSRKNATEVETNKTILKTFGQSGWQVYLLNNVKVFRAARMTRLTSFDLTVNVVRGERLQLIDISDSGFNNFTKPISGFTGLRFVDLSSNQMSVVTENWFDYLPKLETLVLSNCQLDGNFMAKKSGRLFSKLKSLQRLDLSTNSLTILSEDMFVYNSHLKMLRLADNRFNVVPFNLKYTPNLTFLDLTNNALVTLDVETRQMLDQFAQGNEGFQLYLDGNILSCGCESLSFLQWLMSTNVTFDKGGIFPCMDQNGVVTNTSTYRNLDVLWRTCWGEFFLQISLVVICLIIIGLLSTFVINKKLTYISHYVIQLFGGFKFQTASDYKTGVFIGYAENDYRFACHTLRSFVEDNLGMTSYLRDRDLLPSTDIARGIVDAINSSWRIVLVFNKTFLLNDDWMMFTFRSAIYAQTPANPNRVIVLVDENHAYNLPTELLNAVVEDNIVVVRHWVMTYELREKLKTLLCPGPKIKTLNKCI